MVSSVVFAPDLSSMTQDYWEAHEKRIRLFDEHKVRHQGRRYILDVKRSTGFDLMVEDGRHLTMGLSPVLDPIGRNKEFGIHFEDQPAVAAQFESWYDHRVLPSTTPFEEAFANWQKRQTRHVPRRSGGETTN